MNLTIQSDWTTLIVAILLSLGLGLTLWLAKRKVDQLRKELRYEETCHAQLMSQNKDLYERRLQDADDEHEVEMKDKVLTMGECIHDRDAIIMACIPAQIHTARYNEDTPKGDEAARWLYLVNCMGFFTNADKTVCRILARGQRLSEANPTQLDKMIQHFKETNTATK